MLLHDYLRRKDAIISKVNADMINLLNEISDPKIREAVNRWQPGQPIADNYPQVDQKKEESEEHEPAETKAPPTHVILEGVIGTLAPVDPIVPPVVAGPDTAIPDAAVGGENTNHTV